MARRTAQPGRTLLTFLLGLAVAYALVALIGDWKPQLGLDLQGGTRITLIAKGDPTSDSMEEARKIIDQRVNGSGVSEAEVVTQGNRFIVVEIPGQSRRDLTETVMRQAQLRFRLVACSDFNPGPCASGATTQDPTPPESEPGSGVSAPASPDASGTANRAPASYADDTDGSETSSPSDAPADEASDGAGDGASDGASDAPTDEASDGATPAGTPVTPAPEGGPDVDDPLTWIDKPNQEAIDAFNAFTCPQDGTPVNVEDDSDKPLVSCEWDSESKIATKYLLSASMIEGSELDDAEAVIPQNEVNYVVAIDFDGSGTKTFTKISEALVGTEKQFAMVLDGQVLSAPTMEALITNGQAQIQGNFTQASAKSLATSLKYGALPIAFEDPSTETIGPSLAGDQLNAGLIAGAFGLGLVLIYCMFYYRGLGIVVVASLLAAAATTYALVLLLSKSAGFTLTLPGIAGLIIAVGITADSFIIFFERIRDEMRDGRGMKVAVEVGWKRAKVTRLAAQVVSLLSAAVLYIFATGVVKGFGFALGLSTIVDLAILFWFTKPMMSWLARFKFFNSGHRLSGLSRETLGMDGMDTVPAGGRA